MRLSNLMQNDQIGLLIGPPKSGKHTFIAEMLKERETNRKVLFVSNSYNGRFSIHQNLKSNNRCLFTTSNTICLDNNESIEDLSTFINLNDIELIVFEGIADVTRTHFSSCFEVSRLFNSLTSLENLCENLSILFLETSKKVDSSQTEYLGGSVSFQANLDFIIATDSEYNVTITGRNVSNTKLRSLAYA